MYRKTFVVFVIAAASFFAGFQFAENNVLESNYFTIGKTTECPFLNKYPASDKSGKCPYLEMNNSVENSESCPYVKEEKFTDTCPFGKNSSDKKLGGKKDNLLISKSI